MSTDQAIIEAAARALQTGTHAVYSDDNAREFASAMLAAVAPLIRAAALEEAAKVAEDEDGEYSWAGEHRNMAMLQRHGYEIAAAIRALADLPADPT